MYKVYGDPGNGFTKCIDNRGNQAFWPSVFGAMPAGSNGTELGIYSEDYGDYLSGESALTLSAMSRHFQNYEDCLTNAYAANVLLAISQMNKGNVIDCELVLSLPFDAMYLQKELIAHLTGTHVIKRLGGKKQTINITFPKDEKGKNKWGVMPQNAAPAFATLDLKSIKREGEIWIAVGNVGSQTFEQGTFGIDLESYALRPGLRAQQATETKGMYTLANDKRPLLIEHFRGKLTSFSQHMIFKILLTGEVEVGNAIIDVSEIINPKKQEYLQIIVNYCRQLWKAQNGKEIGEIYQFCLSGGGAHIVVDYLRSVNFHNNIVVSDNPQFDVVRGLQKWHELVGS